ncbi:MAG: hypothetical protein JNK04_02060 [Myxococcales bacterium]|nr:hypothetical protein [Myxococcales bacterium]
MNKHLSLRSARTIVLSAALLGSLWMTSVTGCETYDSPPRTSIQGIVDGILTDPEAPLVLRFSEPIDRETLRVQVIKLVTDIEGNLLDEDDDDATTLQSFFSLDPLKGNNFGGQVEFLDDDAALRISLDNPLPIGPSLAILIEPGLKDLEGNEWIVRQVIPFGYELGCDDATGTDKFPSGAYFFLVDVEVPIPVQIQLWGQINVDPDTGLFVGQFTNADRNPDGSRCDPPCGAEDACRLLPAEECVVPSTKAGSEDEFSDFVPNDVLPVGYTFTVGGCVIEQKDGSVVFINEPADVDITQPDVFVQGIQLTSSFGTDGSGVFRGTGAVTGETVFIGPTDSGAASGNLVARFVDAAEAPTDIPGPPAQ